MVSQIFESSQPQLNQTMRCRWLESTCFLLSLYVFCEKGRGFKMVNLLTRTLPNLKYSMRTLCQSEVSIHQDPRKQPQTKSKKSSH